MPDKQGGSASGEKGRQTPENGIGATARRRLGLATRAEPIRHHLRESARARTRSSDTKLARFRLPPSIRTGKTWSSTDIDAALYVDPRERS